MPQAIHKNLLPPIAIILGLLLLYLALASNYQHTQADIKRNSQTLRQQTREALKNYQNLLRKEILERSKDVELLSQPPYSKNPSEFIERFTQLAKQIQQNKPNIALINLIDNQGIIQASIANPDTEPLPIGTDLWQFPDREAQHRNVLDTQKTLLSSPLQLKSGKTGLVLWAPIHRENPKEGGPYMIAATFHLDHLLFQHLSVEATQAYHLVVECNGIRVLDTHPKSDNAQGAPYKATTQELLFGQWWSLSATPLPSKLPPPRTGFFTSQAITLISASILVVLLFIAWYKESREKQSLLNDTNTLRQLVENIHEAHYRVSEKGIIEFITPPIENILGYKPDEFIGKSFLDFIHPEDRETIREAFWQRLSGVVKGEQYRLVHKNGSTRHVYSESKPFFNPEGKVQGLHGTLQDVTDRHEAQKASKEAAEILQTAIQQSHAGILIADAPDGNIRLANAAALLMRGKEANTLTNIPFAEHPKRWKVFHTNGQPCKSEELPLTRAIQKGETIQNEEYIIRDQQEREHWIAANAAPVRNQEGQITAGIVIFLDITEEKQALQAYNAQNTYLEAVAKNIPGILYRFQIDQNNRPSFPFLSPGTKQVFGITAEEGMADISKVFDRVHPEDLPLLLETAEASSKNLNNYELEHRLIQPDGTIRWVKAVSTPIRQQDGATVWSGMCLDISAQKEAEARYQTYLEKSPIAILRFEREKGLIREANATAHHLLGYSHREILQMRLEDILSEPDVAPRILQASSATDLEIAFQAKDGKQVLFSIASTILPDDSLLIFCNDITQRKQLQEQLVQSQKMEAIGQLAGGIAHDFNNLLQVINGHAELALSSEPEDKIICQDLHEIHYAGERAIRLVSQLLSFSRQQVMRLEPIQIDAVLHELTSMLERLLGETIQLDYTPKPEAPTIFADRNMLEQVITNLAINARDAMPHGGTLKMDVSEVLFKPEDANRPKNIKPGEYALLQISDTGVGMDAEVQQHIFEPFFTTKEFGKGTGLGLATAYGIIQQHEGHITLKSALGKGTTFLIYLPAKNQEIAQATQEKNVAIQGGNEHILLAEDEHTVRDIANKILTKAGYNVTAARDGEEALELFEEKGDSIDALVFDIVMPRLGGGEALNRIRMERPDIPAVMISGYSLAIATAEAKIGPKPHRVQKPFTQQALLQALRNAIDQEPPA